ncbi:MAG: aminotransferase [Porticoccaceae bacterium]|nr:aminotransferase [Porticoccaceae bacterium]
MARQARGQDIIRMEVGEPVFELPPRVAEAARSAVDGDHKGYTSSLGIPPLRQAIADFYRHRYAVDLDPERVVVTTGSSAALGMVCDLLLNPGDRLLLTDPGYPCNANFVRRCDALPARIPVDAENHYQPTPSAVASHWQQGTRALLVASPSNPTGDVLDAAAITGLNECVRARDGWLIVDEIYHGLCYTDGGLSTALACGEDIIVINSFSKYFAMPGWRLGWMVLPETAIPPVRLMTQNFFISPPAIAQHAALAAFHPESLAEFDARRETLRQRRDFLVPALRELGFTISHFPPGAFYVYAGIDGLADDCEDLCWQLLDQAGVSVTPGTDFGNHRAHRHVRFSYTAEPLPRLKEAVRRLAGVLGKPIPTDART